MNNVPFTICATGHRSNKLFGYNLYVPEYANIAKNIRTILVEEITKHKNVLYVCGGALGIDQLFGLVVVKLKENFSNVYLELAIPYRDYTKMWKDTKYYDILLTKCDIKTVVNDEPYKLKHMPIKKYLYG